MQTSNKPENNNNSHEAHPSLGKALKDHCPKCGIDYTECPNTVSNEHGNHMCARCFEQLPDNLQEAFYL